MTLHSGHRLPLNVSAPRPAGPNQRAPPCCPPSPRLPLAASSHSAQKVGNKTPAHFSVPLLSRLLHKAPALRSNGELGGGRQSRRAAVFVRSGDFAFLPHLLFGTPIKSHSFRTFPARSRLSARPGPTMARRSEASPFTRLGTLTIGRVAAQASHRHSPQVTRSRIKPRPPGEKGGRPRGRARPRRGAAPLGAPAEPERAAFAPPRAGLRTRFPLPG